MGTTMTRFIVPACTLVCRSTSERRTTTAPGGAIGITTAGMATDTGHIITGAPWRVTTVAGAMMRRVRSEERRVGKECTYRWTRWLWRKREMKQGRRRTGRERGMTYAGRVELSQGE